MVFDPNVFDSDVFDAGVNAPAELASGSGSAFGASILVVPRAELASGTGAAYDATISTSPVISANAEVASGTGSAYDASTSVAVNAGLASGTGTANNATALAAEYRSANAEVATGTGTAHSSSVKVSVNANATTMPTFVAMGTRDDDAAANISPAIPSGTAAGDILLLVVETNHATVANPDSSVWTELSVSPWSSTAGSSPTRISAFWRVAISSTPAPTVVFSADHVFGVIAGFRGVDTTNPFNQLNTYDAAGNVSSYTAPSVTTTVPNTLIVNIATSGRDQTSTALFQTPSNANLSDLTVRYHQGLATGDGGCIWIATGGKATAGSTGTTTGSLAVGGLTQIAITVGLQPPNDTSVYGRAYNATISTDTTVSAELASGTGAAYDASIHVAPRAGISTGTGAALSATPSVAVNAEGATGTGAAYDATVSTTLEIYANADVATGSGAAYNPSIHVAPRAGLGSGTGTAYDATVSTAVTTVTHVQSLGLDAHILSFGQHDRIDFHYGVQPDTAITYDSEVLDVVLARLFESVDSVTDPNTFRLYAYIRDYIPYGDTFSLDAYIFAGHPLTMDAVIHKVWKVGTPFAAVIAAALEWNVVNSPVGGGEATYTAISTDPGSQTGGQLRDPSRAANGIKFNDFFGDAWKKDGAGVIGDWWQVDWTVPQVVNRVVLYDGGRQSDDDAFTAARFGNTGTVTFSDGSSVPYSGLNDTYVVLDFAPRDVSWLRVTSTTAGGSQCSLSEVEAYNTDQFS